MQMGWRSAVLWGFRDLQAAMLTKINRQNNYLFCFLHASQRPTAVMVLRANLFGYTLPGVHCGETL
jgi:hypothetical protein